jgi:CheY-like chemotaxis protein
MDPQPKQILVIEDDLEMISLLKDLFEEDGYQVDSVENGSEAFRRAARQVYDLIITDVRMPFLSGLEILPGLKKLQPHTPVLVITAFGSEDVQRRAKERGAEAYLEKPIDLFDLRRLVDKMMSAKETEEDRGGENAR